MHCSYSQHGLFILAAQLAEMERAAMQQRALEISKGDDAQWAGTCLECLEPIRRRRTIDYVRAKVERGEESNPYICECVTRFRAALDEPLHHRCINQNHLRKELSESMAIVKATEAMLLGLEGQLGRAVNHAELVLVDCCCGTGLTSVLLSAAFPQARVVGIDILSPRSITHFSSQKASVRRVDLFAADQMLQELTGDGSAAVLIGMHLCGFLSTKCVELFCSLGRKCLGVVLSPCCLPKNTMAMQSGLGDLVSRAKRLGISNYLYWCFELAQKMRAVGDFIVDMRQDTDILSPRCSVITARRRIADVGSAASPHAAGSAGEGQVRLGEGQPEDVTCRSCQLSARYCMCSSDSAPAGHPPGA
jgi:hypothetical protein